MSISQSSASPLSPSFSLLFASDRALPPTWAPPPPSLWSVVYTHCTLANSHCCCCYCYPSWNCLATCYRALPTQSRVLPRSLLPSLPLVLFSPFLPFLISGVLHPPLSTLHSPPSPPLPRSSRERCVPHTRTHPITHTLSLLSHACTHEHPLSLLSKQSCTYP